MRHGELCVLRVLCVLRMLRMCRSLRSLRMLRQADSPVTVAQCFWSPLSVSI